MTRSSRPSPQEQSPQEQLQKKTSPPEMSFSFVARHCGVSVQAVRSWALRISCPTEEHEAKLKEIGIFGDWKAGLLKEPTSKSSKPAA